MGTPLFDRLVLDRDGIRWRIATFSPQGAELMLTASDLSDLTRWDSGAGLPEAPTADRAGCTAHGRGNLIAIASRLDGPPPLLEDPPLGWTLVSSTECWLAAGPRDDAPSAITFFGEWGEHRLPLSFDDPLVPPEPGHRG